MKVIDRQGSIPFVGCFKSKEDYFLYDVNTNEILEVDSSVFSSVAQALENPEKAKEHLDTPSVRTLQERGYLSTHRPEALIGYCDDCLVRGQESEVSQVTIELTQQCNQRCLYCPYSPQDQGRRPHSSSRMEWNTARAAIDYLFDHSTDVEMPALSFYGGEPFLEWPLMQKCIEYAAGKFADRKLLFTVTTNATLVNEEVASVLALHHVAVLVSLDGPEDIHNAFRKMPGAKEGGFSKTLAGLMCLRQAYGSTASTKIRINGVYGPWTDFSKLEDFFLVNPPPAIQGLRYRFAHVNHPGLAIPSPDEGIQQSSGSTKSFGEYYQRWSDLLVEGNHDGDEGLFLNSFFESAMDRLHNRSRCYLGDNLGAMGMCKPGVRKCYVNVEGEILLCEKVHERFVVGNIHEGGSRLSLAKDLLNDITRSFGDKCTNCIFCRICAGCPGGYATEDGRITPESVGEFCANQSVLLGWQLLTYAEALKKNPNSFAHLERDTEN